MRREGARVLGYGVAAVVLAFVFVGPARADNANRNAHNNDKARKQAEKAARQQAKHNNNNDAKSDRNNDSNDDNSNDNGDNANSGANDRRENGDRSDTKIGSGANDRCRFNWSASSEGRPQTLREGAAAGLYLWHDAGKWSLVATHPGGDSVTFQGTVTFDAPVSVQQFQLEKSSDSFQQNGNQTSFVFRNSGHLDGLKLRSDCATSITVTASLNGQPLVPQQFFVGRAAQPAQRAPFVETRTAAPVVAPPPTVAPTIPASPCGLPAWNPLYVGKPATLRAGAAAGLYLWIDGDRFTLETTRSNSNASTISGSIAVNAPVLDVRGHGLDPNSDVLNPQTDGASFSFLNTGGIDGLEIRSPCATRVTVNATIDGQPVSPVQVWVGRGGIQPPGVPIVLAR